jgi:hypothetical protein
VNAPLALNAASQANAGPQANTVSN